MQAPSLSNSTGTLLGTIAGSLVAASAANLPFVIATSAALGMTPIAFAGILAVAATALVNYGVTHFAEVKNINELAKEWYPQIVASYPNDPKPAASVGQANSNINKG